MLDASTGLARRTEKLRVSEVYASIQGEGPRTGMATLFVRFGGCNLRCPGWPCDTVFAIDPKYRNEWDRRSGRDLLDEIIGACRGGNIANVCLTGGEPFLQQSGVLEFIVDGCLDRDIQVEAFSNGQVPYPQWAFDKVNFIMDWKLPGSGNAADRTEEILQLQLSNIELLKPTDAIKLVIKDTDDYNHAIDIWSQYEHLTEAQWYAGVVWSGGMTEQELVSRMLDDQLPWNLNVQMHKYIWPPDERGV